MSEITNTQDDQIDNILLNLLFPIQDFNDKGVKEIFIQSMLSDEQFAQAKQSLLAWREAYATQKRIDAYADCGSKGGTGTEVRSYAKSRAYALSSADSKVPMTTSFDDEWPCKDRSCANVAIQGKAYCEVHESTPEPQDNKEAT